MELAYNERLWNTKEVERVCDMGLAHTTPVNCNGSDAGLVNTDRMDCQHLDIETITDLEEATDGHSTKVSNSTEPSTLSMS